MKFNFTYFQEVGWIGSIKHEAGIDDDLMNCPFCGSTNIEIHNTDNPHYWARCECSVQIDSNHFSVHRYDNKGQCKKIHEQAFKSAIDNWNTRE